MKRWIGLAVILALLMIVTMVSPVTADVTDLSINITDYERNPASGSSFDVKFTVYVPPGVSMPTTNCSLYYSTFYFVNDVINYPAEGYWWGSYKGSAWYNTSQTDYTVKAKMYDNAPVGQTFSLGIYWKIPLAANWEKITDNTGENFIRFTLGENVYTTSIVDTDTYPEYVRYTISKISGGPIIYVKTDEMSLLYVRALKSDLTVSAAPGTGLPLIPIVGALVVLLVIVAVVVVVKKRGAVEVPLPPPPAPPTI